MRKSNDCFKIEDKSDNRSPQEMVGMVVVPSDSGQISLGGDDGDGLSHCNKMISEFCVSIEKRLMASDDKCVCLSNGVIDDVQSKRDPNRLIHYHFQGDGSVIDT